MIEKNCEREMSGFSDGFNFVHPQFNAAIPMPYEKGENATLGKDVLANGASRCRFEICHAMPASGADAGGASAFVSDPAAWGVPASRRRRRGRAGGGGGRGRAVEQASDDQVGVPPLRGGAQLVARHRGASKARRWTRSAPSGRIRRTTRSPRASASSRRRSRPRRRRGRRRRRSRSGRRRAPPRRRRAAEPEAEAEEGAGMQVEAGRRLRNWT